MMSMLTAGCGKGTLRVLHSSCGMLARQPVANRTTMASSRRSLRVTSSAAVEADGGETSISPSNVNVALHSMRIRDALRQATRRMSGRRAAQLACQRVRTGTRRRAFCCAAATSKHQNACAAAGRVCAGSLRPRIGRGLMLGRVVS
jgi:hypothetical protein